MFLLWKYEFDVTSAGDFNPPIIIKVPNGYRVFGPAAWYFSPDTVTTTPLVNILYNGPSGAATENEFGLYTTQDRLSFFGSVDQAGTFTLWVPLVPTGSLLHSY